MPDVVGIPLLLLLFLCIGRKRGTLHYPAVEFEGAAVDPRSVERAVRRTNEYFRNRVAYESLYLQYEAQYWWCVPRGAVALFSRRLRAECARTARPRARASSPLFASRLTMFSLLPPRRPGLNSAAQCAR